jgi:aminopeptidase N
MIALGMSSVAYAEDVPAGAVWTLTHLDVDVVLHPEQETLRMSGTMTLRCEDESMGPRLVLNSRHAVLEFVSVEGAGVAAVELNVAGGEDGAVRYTRIDLLELARPLVRSHLLSPESLLV